MNRQPRILFIAAELTPLAKSGGLADVVGALPIALRGLGYDVRVVIPRYSMIDVAALGYRRTGELPVTVSEGTFSVSVWEGVIPQTDVPVYLLEHADFLSRGSIYFEQSVDEKTFAEFRRFLFFHLAVVEFLRRQKWQPDLLHCHDWEAALVPLLTSRRYRSVLTLHNLAVQGAWNRREVHEFMRLTDGTLPSVTFGNPADVNILGIGIETADRVTTVSPTYAQEIFSREFGMGLEGVLQKHSAKVRGILNGIDVDRFNPATDPAIVAYGPDTLERKLDNRARLLQRFNLRGAGPIYGFVGRLTEQKGIDLIAESQAFFSTNDANLIILGKGLKPFEALAESIGRRLPRQAAIVVGFDAALAQQLYAGCDFFLMPSRFEPCGLVQMIALRYGTPPIVRATGGLKDTVRDVAGSDGTGVVFTDYSAAALTRALERSVSLFREPERLRTIQRRGMAEDFSWTRSAKEYADLYRSMLQERSET